MKFQIINRNQKFTQVYVSIVKIDKITTVILANQEEERKTLENFFV